MKDQIKEAAEKYRKSTVNQMQIEKRAFTAGAEYALSLVENKWVSVEERLPEEEQWVIVAKNTTYGLDVMLMAHQFYRRFRNGFIPYGEPFPRLDGITHWMPLPSPPNQ